MLPRPADVGEKAELCLSSHAPDPRFSTLNSHHRLELIAHCHPNPQTGRPALAALVLILLVSRSAAAGSVTLTWDPIAAPVAGYIVCYGTAAEIYANCTAVGPVTTWSLSGATARCTASTPRTR
jgi:hypothetical protein